jgi:hypothetical protein
VKVIYVCELDRRVARITGRLSLETEELAREPGQREEITLVSQVQFKMTNKQQASNPQGKKALGGEGP